MNVFVEASQALVEPLEAFFNNVFVMAVSALLIRFSFGRCLLWSTLITCLASGAQEEEELRNNRLALLTSVANLPRGIADLSVLPGF